MSRAGRGEAMEIKEEEDNMSTSMKKRALGKSGLEVSAIGFGCMGLSFGYGPRPGKEEGHFAHPRRVRERCDFFDAALAYGALNEEMVGEALAPIRDKVVIATKFGFKDGNSQAGMDSRPERIRLVADTSRERMQASPRRALAIEPKRSRMPVRGIVLP